MKRITIISFITILFFIAGCAGSKQVTDDGYKCPPNKYAKMPGYRAFAVADKTFHDGYLNKIEYIPSGKITFRLISTSDGAKKYVDGVYIEEKKEDINSIFLCEGSTGVFFGEQNEKLLILWVDESGEETILAFKPSASSSREYKLYGWYNQETEKITFVSRDKLECNCFITLYWVSQDEIESEEKQRNLRETTIEGETIRE